MDTERTGTFARELTHLPMIVEVLMVEDRLTVTKEKSLMQPVFYMEAFYMFDFRENLFLSTMNHLFTHIPIVCTTEPTCGQPPVEIKVFQAVKNWARQRDKITYFDACSSH